MFQKSEDGITVRNWTISRKKTTIGNDTEMKDWSNKLGLSILPEMVFGNNFLTIKNETTGQELSFNCIDGLDQVDKTTLPNIVVMASETWRKGYYSF
jgi:type 2A phosphatase activator TIP41